MSRCKWLVTGMVLTSLIFMGGCASDNNNSGIQNNSTAALAAIIAPGDVCANGGFEIKTGIDTNGNDALDADEILNTENVCNGTDGLNSVILVTDAAPADCPNGGAQIDAGIDGNDDGLIDVIDPTKAQYVCNGEDAVVAQTVGHATLPAKAVATVTGVTVAADNTIDVAFHVETAESKAVTDLLIGDIRIYISDIVPAGTVSATTFVDTLAPITKFKTAQLERWAYERSSTTGAALDTTDAAKGNYVFNLVSTTADTLKAPDADLANHNQRVLVRVGGDDVNYNDTIALADFVMPATGATVAPLAALSRSIVAMSACTACHNDPLQNAAHGGGYQSPDACVVCHTPLGDQYGDEMQNDEAWLAPLIHKIHAAIDMPAFPTRINGGGYSNVTYPMAINDCEVCHADEGQAQATNWKSNPTAEACTSCHVDTTFTGTVTHAGGEASNEGCVYCHNSAKIVEYHVVTELKHADVPTSITPVYAAAISLSAAADPSGIYVADEVITVTVTTDVADTDYINDYKAANLYVYGPRANALPVLTTGSTTDPAYDPAVKTATQSHKMLATAAAADVNVLTDATGFKYQLQAIPENLAPGTYMVQVAIGHNTLGRSPNPTSSHAYNIDGWALTTIQIGVAGDAVADEPKVAGECAGCHTTSDWSSMYHRSYFGTDGCLACHDQSGGHAAPIANRVHAVHAASATGDQNGIPWDGSDPEIHAPTFPQETASCVACHTSGNTSYQTNMFKSSCIGCHAEATGGVEAHMNTNMDPITGKGACIACHGAGKSAAIFE